MPDQFLNFALLPFQAHDGVAWGAAAPSPVVAMAALAAAAASSGSTSPLA